jgi:hypothetical protein
MAAKKSARKSAKKGRGKPFVAGDPRSGRGPRKGAPNAGRPPDAFKALCQEMATRDETLAAVRAILADRTHPQFMAALKWASENGYGRPTQALEVTGKGGGPVETRQSIVFGDRVIAF